MMMETTPARSSRRVPPPYDLVRSSCQAFQTDRVVVNIEAAMAFAKELNVEQVQLFGQNLALDVNYSGSNCNFDGNVDVEAAFIVLFHALDFGSGWRIALHKHHKKGAFCTIKPGVEQLYKKYPNLLSTELMNVTKKEVAQCFALEGNPELDDLVELLRQVIVELGTNTKEEYGSLPNFLNKKLQDLSHETPAGDLIWDLIDTFPHTFDDCYNIVAVTENGKAELQPQRVCLYKKAQLVVGELFHRFRQIDIRFSFVDGTKLTAYIDNVICACLRYKKVILPCPELHQAIMEEGQEIPSGSEDEVALRAAAVVGLECILKQLPTTTSAKPPLSSNELGNYLWGGLGKLPHVRKYPRHATKTIFY